MMSKLVLLNVTSHRKTFLMAIRANSERTANARITNGWTSRSERMQIFFRTDRVERLNGC